MRSAALLVLLAGCLEVPTGPGHECSTTSDCPSGEVCDEGTCWGNPPSGSYAATVAPPAVRRDSLVSTEIPQLSLPQDGWLGDITLEPPVSFSGRVEAACNASQSPCSTTSIAAEVRVTRPSRFPGGPALRFSAQSTPGLERGQDSFTILLPRTQPGDPPYKVTIDPAGGGERPPSNGGKDPAELVPPKRLLLDASLDIEHQTYVLGSSAPMTISGALKDSLANYLTNYRVVALGRWDLTSAPTEVSSVCFSTDGQYSIQLSDGIVGPIEIVAKPWEAVAPTLRLANVEPYGPQTRNMAQPSGLGSRVDLAITIEGQVSVGGGVKPISGARVQIIGSTTTTVTTGVHAVMAAEAITGDDGIAHLTVLDGQALASSYHMNVVPPAGHQLGIVYGAPVVLVNPPKVRLQQRLALSGKVVDINGNPLADVSVTARRSLRFLWSLEGEEQAFLNEIPAATTITPDTGEFIVWVDPSVASAWGHYDLFFETPDGSVAPSWAIPDFEIPRVPDQTTLSLDDVQIPDAAYLHGKIVDGAGVPVEGSSLRVFLISSDQSVCQEVFNAPEECADDAKVLGHGESDDEGLVRFTLPRP